MNHLLFAVLMVAMGMCCVSAYVPSPYPSGYRQHQVDNFLQQLLHTQNEEEVKMMQNDQLSCGTVFRNSGYGFSCCYDRVQEHFCVNYVGNMIGPCMGAFSGCTPRSMQPGANFLRGLRFCTIENSKDQCADGITLPPCNMPGGGDKEAEAIAILADIIERI